MFGLFKKKNPHKEIALSLYAEAMMQSRAIWFYESAGVPDSYDGRFDCLLLHVFLIMQKLNESAEGKEVAQELFDVTFADVDQSLREIGVGDTGMKRRMKNMMLAFNGRMHAYQAAKEHASDEAWLEVLARNLYGTVETPEHPMVKQVSDYVLRALAELDGQTQEQVLSGNVRFPSV